jgi:cobalt/nickel transport system permease protein
VHIPDGFVSVPTAIGTGVVAAGAVAYALREGRESLADRQVPVVGVTSAFVFAVQMINFPIAFGTSGHLIGGALAAVLLGPWMACLVLAVVLLVQAIMFADGGITAIGANVTLMGVVAGIGGHYLFRAVASVLPRGRSGFLAATAITSWATVVIASAVCTLFITVGGVFGADEVATVATAMIGLHALIGVGEALITTAAVAAVIAARPDLVANGDLLDAGTATPRAVAA